MNANLQQGLKVATIAGSAVIAIGAVTQLVGKPITIKGSWLPILTVLVGVSAFSYAMTSDVSFIPKTGK